MDLRSLRRLATILAMVLALFPAACSKGGDTSSADSNDGAPSTSVTETEGDATGGSMTIDGHEITLHGTIDLATLKESEVEVETDDYYFAPTVIKAAPDSQVILGFGNESETLHNVSIPSQDIDQDLMPDSENEILVKVPASGEVAFSCKYHAQQGMVGVIETA